MKRATARKLRAEVDELKRRLARAEEDCKVIVQQRDEFAENARGFRSALDTVMASMKVLFDGAQLQLTTADDAADRRMRSRYRDQAMTPDRKP